MTVVWLVVGIHAVAGAVWLVCRWMEARSCEGKLRAQVSEEYGHHSALAKEIHAIELVNARLEKDNAFWVEKAQGLEAIVGKTNHEARNDESAHNAVTGRNLLGDV